AARLGEVALVDVESRVAGLGQVFGDILLDENASSHIGLGHGFPSLLPAAGHALANSSAHHLDLMIGGPEVEVHGRTRGGGEEVLLREGRWAELSAAGV